MGVLKWALSAAPPQAIAAREEEWGERAPGFQGKVLQETGAEESPRLPGLTESIPVQNSTSLFIHSRKAKV